MYEDSPIAQLVEEILISGRTPEDVCADCPERLDEVRSRLRRVQSIAAQLDDLFPSSSVEPNQTLRTSGYLFGKLPDIPGYEVKSIHGRGGMGVVYKARQLKLNRIVALKMLLSGEYASVTERKRFLREAKAVARLSHPHVVQVHDLGECDGRPYFTMEFIEGGTLAHKLNGAPQPAGEAAELIRTLADAMQAAHDAGIVHRDLKPSNILLTPDETPKISDFGLARYSDRDSTVTISELHIGTPSYMAPEQAVGKNSDIGPATDIYALGAILYEMLTGRPPFRGETSSETIRQLLNQEPVPPSRLNSRVPRDLQTICLQCLNKDAKRRYPSAAALAQDIERFQRGEPITARPTGIIERTGKWIRRRPGLAAAIAAGVIICGTGMSGALWLATDRAATVRAAEEDLQQVEEAEYHSDWTAAATALDRARVRMQNHSIGSLNERLNRDEQDLEFGQRLESIGLNRTAWVENRFARLFDNSHADAAYSTALQEGGIARDRDDPAAVARRIGIANDRYALIAALDDWMICATDPARRQWLYEVLSAADSDPTGWRNRVRDPSASRTTLLELAQAQTAIYQPVRLLAALGERLDNAGASAEAIAFLRRVQTAYPGDFWANFTLADSLRKNGKCDESVRYYQAAIALRPRSTVAIGNLGMALAADNHLAEAEDQFRQEIQIDPLSSHAHYSLGLALRKLGNVDEALTELAESVRLEPDNANHQYNLALALVDKGQLDSAADHFQSALAITPNDADTRYNLGLVMMTQNKNDQAINQFRQALKIDPKNAQAEYCLGLVLKSTGNFNEASQHLQTSIKLDPTNAAAHYNLALAFVATGKASLAIDEFQSALKLDPNQPDAHYNLAVTLMNQAKNDEAIEQFQQTVKLSPNNAQAHYLLGLLLKGEGKFDASVPHLQLAARLNPNDPYAHYNLGLGLAATGKDADAISEFQKSLKINPKQSDVYYNLGFVLMKEGKNDRAVQNFREAIQLNPNNSRAQYYLGLLLKGAGQVEEAIDHLRRASDLDPADPYAHYNLALGLMATGKNAQAIDQFESSLKIDSDQPDVHYNLGLALMSSQKLDDAIDHFRRAIALNPTFGYAYGGLGNALMGEARFAEAKAALEHCLKILPTTDPWRQQYVDVLQQCRLQMLKRSR